MTVRGVSSQKRCRRCGCTSIRVHLRDVCVCVCVCVCHVKTVTGTSVCAGCTAAARPSEHLLHSHIAPQHAGAHGNDRGEQETISVASLRLVYLSYIHCDNMMYGYPYTVRPCTCVCSVPQLQLHGNLLRRARGQKQ